MRDRFIELHRNAFLHLLDTEKPFTHANYADFLLANGVIVPPCKVGQTVYMPWEWNGVRGIAFLTVTHIIIDCSKSFVKTDFNTDDEDYWSTYGCGEFDFTDFGKTVFLTREEAKKALERSEE